jgi:hypothetical protein
LQAFLLLNSFLTCLPFYYKNTCKTKKELSFYYKNTCKTKKELSFYYKNTCKNKEGIVFFAIDSTLKLKLGIRKYTAFLVYKFKEITKSYTENSGQHHLKNANK